MRRRQQESLSCQRTEDPRDQLVPGRLHTQAAGKKRFDDTPQLEAAFSLAAMKLGIREQGHDYSLVKVE